MKGRASAELGCLNQYLTTTLGCLVGTVQQASREISSCRIGHLPPQVSSQESPKGRQAVWPVGP